MSEYILEIIESASTDNNSKVWLNCHPIAEPVPLDAPDLVKSFINNYWAGKILFTDTNKNLREATDWFSIPEENIIRTVRINRTREFYVNVDRLTQQEKNELFYEVTPSFSIDSKMSPEIKKWLDDL